MPQNFDFRPGYVSYLTLKKKKEFDDAALVKLEELLVFKQIYREAMFGTGR